MSIFGRTKSQIVHNLRYGISGINVDVMIYKYKSIRYLTIITKYVLIIDTLHIPTSPNVFVGDFVGEIEDPSGKKEVRTPLGPSYSNP